MALSKAIILIITLINIERVFITNRIRVCIWVNTNFDCAMSVMSASDDVTYKQKIIK